jgi:hypothetical protein
MEGSKKVGGSRVPPLEKKTKSTTTAKRSEDKAPSTPSKLLEIPPELRNRIFRYALVSDEPIKVGIQSYSSRGRTRHRFDMLPGLFTVSKQVRHETQAMFFVENEFEITHEVMKERNAAPLLLLRTTHQNVGLEFYSARFCLEMKRRFEGELFQVKTAFAITMTPLDENGNVIFNIDQDYWNQYIGRPHNSQVPPSLGACGCMFDDFCSWYFRGSRKKDVTDFLLTLKKRNKDYLRTSCHPVDLNRTDEVVKRGEECWQCRRKGRFNMWF